MLNKYIHEQQITAFELICPENINIEDVDCRVKAVYIVDEYIKKSKGSMKNGSSKIANLFGILNLKYCSKIVRRQFLHILPW